LRRPFHSGSLPRAIFRAVAICATVGALLMIALWPSKSHAAIIPACENDVASQILPPAHAHLDESCEGSSLDDDIDNSRAAPMCDSRGASFVAPPRLRGVSDLRFERGGPCDSGETLRAAVSPHRGDPPVSPSEVTLERAMLPPVPLLSAARLVALIDLPAPAGGPRAGVRRTIYHPPR
jgi:hypothetical protein